MRLSVANYEALAANALRRGLRSGERSVVARVDDLEALAASSIGKIEIESLEEGREGAIFENLVKGAVLTVFKDRVEPEQTRDVVVDAFEEGAIAHTGEDITSDQLAGLVDTVPALRIPVLHLTGGDESPAAVAAAVEFVLEGLHLSKRLNKDASGNRATYRGRVLIDAVSSACVESFSVPRGATSTLESGSAEPGRSPAAVGPMSRSTRPRWFSPTLTAGPTNATSTSTPSDATSSIASRSCSTTRPCESGSSSDDPNEAIASGRSGPSSAAIRSSSPIRSSSRSAIRSSTIVEPVDIGSSTTPTRSHDTSPPSSN